MLVLLIYTHYFQKELVLSLKKKKTSFFPKYFAVLAYSDFILGVLIAIQKRKNLMAGISCVETHLLQFKLRLKKSFWCSLKWNLYT